MFQIWNSVKKKHQTRERYSTTPKKTTNASRRWKIYRQVKSTSNSKKHNSYCLDCATIFLNNNKKLWAANPISWGQLTEFIQSTAAQQVTGIIKFNRNERKKKTNKKEKAFRFRECPSLGNRLGRELLRKIGKVNEPADWIGAKRKHLWWWWVRIWGRERGEMRMSRRGKGDTKWC